MNDRIVLLKGHPGEFLREALGNGLLNGEAMKAADAVIAENAALRRENAILRGRLAEQRKVNRAYWETHLAALNYRFDAEEGWKYSRGHRWQMMFAAVGMAIALTCLACSIALCW